MERPDNDDLYEYYNRASTKKGANGNNNRRGSREGRSENKNLGNTAGINLSKEKLDNDRKMEKIYMQRLDSSLNNQRNNSRNRY